MELKLLTFFHNFLVGNLRISGEKGTRSSPWRYCGRKMRAAWLLGQRFLKENSKCRKSTSCPTSSRFPFRCRNGIGISPVLGIPIPKTSVIWASPVTLILTLTQLAKVIWEGDPISLGFWEWGCLAACTRSPVNESTRDLDTTLDSH